MSNSPIVARINSMLAERGIPKQEFYKACGITSASYSLWNTGKTRPRMKNLKTIADFLGVPLSYLLGDAVTTDGVIFSDGTGYDGGIAGGTGFGDGTGWGGPAPDLQKNGTPPLKAEGKRSMNVVKIAGRDGSFREKQLDDKGLQALIAFIDLLPDAGDDL